MMHERERGESRLSAQRPHGIRERPGRGDGAAIPMTLLAPFDRRLGMRSRNP